MHVQDFVWVLWLVVDCRCWKPLDIRRVVRGPDLSCKDSGIIRIDQVYSDRYGLLRIVRSALTTSALLVKYIRLVERFNEGTRACGCFVSDNVFSGSGETWSELGGCKAARIRARQETSWIAGRNIFAIGISSGLL
jgi:hypothetical protein